MKITWDDGGFARSMDLAVESVSDLNAVLRKFGKYLRDKAKGHFSQQGPGWPPLAQSTQERLQHTRTGAVTSQGLLRKSYVKNVTGLLKGRYKKDKEGAGTALRELGRLQHGDIRGMVNTRLAQRLQKQLIKAEEKGGPMGGKREAERHKILGKLASSLTAKVEKGVLIVESRVPWAGVHNEGGSAGHGATIPARPFLFLEAEDMAVLERMALEHVLNQ